MTSRACLAWIAALAAWPPARGVAADVPATCNSCHAAAQERLAASVHHAVPCRDCHEGAETYTVPADQAEALRRGGAAALPFEHGAGFVAQPARQDVPALCGDCHADVTRMNPFGLRTDQLAQYKTSMHGQALFVRQDERVAVCTDCHGPAHDVLAPSHPLSRTYPLNVPDTCGRCHADAALMGHYALPAEVVAEYRASVHGRALLEKHDTGAPTCSTCHGNHSAAPPGFASVGAVCGRCHELDAKYFATSIHAGESDFRGCVHCHGGGEGRHFHQIERITRPTDAMVERYAHLLAAEPAPTPERVSAAIHPEVAAILTRTVPLCTPCHADGLKDENLAKLFSTLGEIASAERAYVKTAARLDEVGRGVLLVDEPRFKFGDAKTHLMALAPVQHGLDLAAVRQKIGDLQMVCDEVNADLDRLQAGLRWRHRLLMPIWALVAVFSIACYVKFRQLKARLVQSGDSAVTPVPPGGAGVTRRGFLDWLIGLGTAAAGAALAVPGLLYLWPAARGGKSVSVKIDGAAKLQPGEAAMVQVTGKAVVVVRGRSGYRAFSAVCTHLGCLVKWDTAAREFKCPCHAAVFDENGHVVSGPPPKPLPEYQVREVGEDVFVSPA